MPELQLGTKYECYSCGAKFYDLGKPDPVCPKCGANQKDNERSETLALSQAARRRRKADLAKLEEEAEAEVIEEIPAEDLEGADLGTAEIEEEEEEDDLDDGEA